MFINSDNKIIIQRNVKGATRTIGPKIHPYLLFYILLEFNKKLIEIINVILFKLILSFVKFKLCLEIFIRSIKIKSERTVRFEKFYYHIYYFICTYCFCLYHLLTVFVIVFRTFTLGL